MITKDDLTFAIVKGQGKANQIKRLTDGRVTFWVTFKTLDVQFLGITEANG
jgi:hypothetical protein